MISQGPHPEIGNGQLSHGFFTISKSDRSVRSDRNKMQFFKNYHNLKFKGKGYLIMP